jgi:cytochrome bd-type quinol oxidase subunit 1
MRGIAMAMAILTALVVWVQYRGKSVDYEPKETTQIFIMIWVLLTFAVMAGGW